MAADITRSGRYNQIDLYDSSPGLVGFRRIYVSPRRPFKLQQGVSLRHEANCPTNPTSEDSYNRLALPLRLVLHGGSRVESF